MELTSRQRKAIRRIGRGQSISRSMWYDPVIRQCYEFNVPELAGDVNVADYVDWETQAMWAVSHPRITPYGKELLDTLENSV